MVDQGDDGSVDTPMALSYIASPKQSFFPEASRRLESRANDSSADDSPFDRKGNGRQKPLPGVRNPGKRGL